MKRKENDAVIFIEPPALRKRRTIAALPYGKGGPDGNLDVWYYGVVKHGPSDVFSRAEGIKRALKLARKAKWRAVALEQHQQLVVATEPKGKSGSIKILNPTGTRQDAIPLLKQAFTDAGLFRVKNDIDRFDLNKISKLAAKANRQLLELNRALIWVAKDIEPVPDGIIRFGTKIFLLTEELRRWKTPNFSLLS